MILLVSQVIEFAWLAAKFLFLTREFSRLSAVRLNRTLMVFWGAHRIQWPVSTIFYRKKAVDAIATRYALALIAYTLQRNRWGRFYYDSDNCQVRC
jgi:hypothetical protein